MPSVAQADPAQQLARAVRTDDAGGVRRVLHEHPELKARLDARGHVGVGSPEAAHRAKDANLAEVLLMLHHGWPVDTRGNEAGATALHWAAFQGHAELVREILAHNPDVSIQSLEYPGTALDWAVYGSKYGWHPEQGDYVSAVDQLLRAGAKAPALRGDLVASEAVLEVLRRNV